MVMVDGVLCCCLFLWCVLLLLPVSLEPVVIVKRYSVVGKSLCLFTRCYCVLPCHTAHTHCVFIVVVVAVFPLCLFSYTSIECLCYSFFPSFAMNSISLSRQTDYIFRAVRC